MLYLQIKYVFSFFFSSLTWRNRQMKLCYFFFFFSLVFLSMLLSSHNFRHYCVARTGQFPISKSIINIRVRKKEKIKNQIVLCNFSLNSDKNEHVLLIGSKVSIGNEFDAKHCRITSEEKKKKLAKAGCACVKQVIASFTSSALCIKIERGKQER